MCLAALSNAAMADLRLARSMKTVFERATVVVGQHDLAIVGDFGGGTN